MLTRIANHAITLPAHDALQLAHGLTQMHDLALDEQDGALWRGAQVGAVQRARHMARIPEPFARDGRDGHGGAHVEDEGDGAAVQVAARVAQRPVDGQLEGCVADVAVGWGQRGGHDFQVIADRGVEVL